MIVSEEVFEQKIVSGLQTRSSVPKASVLASRLSTIASRTMSQPERSSSRVVVDSFARAASRAAASSLPFSTARAIEPSMRERPLRPRSSVTSRTRVSYPAFAATSAMPAPMSPAPSTPTLSIFIVTLRAIPEPRTED